jgi:hypothetical protein
MVHTKQPSSWPDRIWDLVEKIVLELIKTLLNNPR